MNLEPNPPNSLYAILSKIDEGRMLEMHPTKDTDLDRMTAIKFLSEKLSGDRIG